MPVDRGVIINPIFAPPLISLVPPSPHHRRDIHRLASRAIIAGIAEPVISLVDTAFVGRLDTADLAAIGMASSVPIISYLQQQ